MAVTLVLPCFHPPLGWERQVCDSVAALQRSIQDPISLVLVLDGGNTGANSPAVAHLKKEIRDMEVVAYPENRGKGFAIRQGVERAKGEIILYTDIDFPYTTDSIVAVYIALKEGRADVAVGVKDDHYYKTVPYLRRVISRLLRLLIRFFLSMPVTDTQCGLKGFRSRVAPLFLKTTIDRYLFDLEFIRNCYRDGSYKVQAIPVELKQNIQFRSMNYRILLPELFNFVKLLFR